MVGALDAAEIVHMGKAGADEHRIVTVGKVGERKVGAEFLAMANLDPADGQHVVDFARGEIVDRLVGGDAEFVQPARLVAGLVDRDGMAVHGKAVRAGQPRRPCADNRHCLSGGRRARVKLPAIDHRRIGREALQQADLNRLALRFLAHAGFLAQRLGRADTGAHAAQNVLVEDRLRRSRRVAGGDLADEQGDIDACRTGDRARRVVAEVAAVGGDQRLMTAQWRMQVGEIRLDPRTLDAVRLHAILELTSVHTVLPFVRPDPGTVSSRAFLFPAPHRRRSWECSRSKKFINW